MYNKLKKIGLIGLLISILCNSACLDPIENSFDKSENSSKTLVINEIVANAPGNDNDWIELYNAGATAIYLKDYLLVDDNIERELVTLPDMTLEPGDFIIIQESDEPPENGSFYVPFKLGANACITLYWGLTIIDVLDWIRGAAPSGYSYGRFPDGIGLKTTLMPTPGMINKKILKPSLIINEILASPVEGGNDWIELYNIGEHIVYLEDYSLVDDNPEHDPVALPNNILEPGKFIVIPATDEEPQDDTFYLPFRLGADDSVTLYQDLDIIDVLDWETGDAPSPYSYGRLPDGAKNVQTLIPTRGMVNIGVLKDL